MKALIFFTLLLNLRVWAFQDTTKMEESDNLILKEKDSSTGIYDTTYETTQDTSRFGILYRTNANMKKMDGLTSYEAVYGKKMDLFWAEIFVSKANGRFECLASNNENVGPSSSDLDQSSVSVTTLGAGLSLRTTLVQEVLNSIINAERFFETSAAALTYNSFNDSFRGKTFTGPGFRADYGIHYRAYPSFHIGPHFSYNLAVVKKPKEEGSEMSNSRSLVLSWTTIGLDLSFYF